MGLRRFSPECAEAKAAEAHAAVLEVGEVDSVCDKHPMKRKRISADELTFLVIERLRENDAVATSHPVIAVVPHTSLSWAVVVAGRGHRNEPESVKRIERIQADLRKLYLLAE